MANLNTNRPNKRSTKSENASKAAASSLGKGMANKVAKDAAKRDARISAAKVRMANSLSASLGIMRNAQTTDSNN